ncbi:MAG: SGNH/GDSL hydrolase family protein [Patescibacteria group bacterium]
MTNVLIYGDSRSWGQIPNQSNIVRRYESKDQWPTILRSLLDADSTIFNNSIPGRCAGNRFRGSLRYKNGIENFLQAYISSIPLDLVIIDLTCNDLKIELEITAGDIYQCLLDYQVIIQSFRWKLVTHKPRVEYIIPTKLGSNLTHEKFYGSDQKLRELSSICNKYGVINCHFQNQITYELDNEFGDDGVHLNKEHNFAFAKYWKNFIQTI